MNKRFMTLDNYYKLIENGKVCVPVNDMIELLYEKQGSLCCLYTYEDNYHNPGYRYNGAFPIKELRVRVKAGRG